MRLLNVVGARPNFVKIAPLVREMNRFPDIKSLLLHTGQHYDHLMSRVFFDDLGLPHPHIYLGVGAGTHAQQTAQIMLRFEEVLLRQPFDVIVVVGDVNSTLACSIVAAKLGIPVAHVEAGLRSFDRTMPEEINRLVTDALSDFLFTTCQDANDNLLREGVSPGKIFFVGNVMVDSLFAHIERAEQSTIRRCLAVSDGRYAVLTLHRPSNVDDKETLAGILAALREIQQDIKIIFPAHPRTARRIDEFGLGDVVRVMENLILIAPVGYLDFLNLLVHATLVLTDSGGLQEETTVLGIPCLTLRHNTERPITITIGTNTLVGTDPDRIVREARRVFAGKIRSGSIPTLWDGRAAERVVEVLRQKVGRA